MKTKKLNLNNLKVESFVTSLGEKDSQTVKGGTSAVCASSLPCGTVVVASVVLVSVGTIIYTINKNDNNNTMCCSYLNPQQCGGNGNTFNPNCV